MRVEKIMDAMNYLPDELLEQTDRLRQRKKIYWKPLAALAACLCLAVGAMLMIPGAKSADNASGAGEYMDENVGTKGNAQLESGTTTGIVACVYEVYEDHITVRYHETDGFCDCLPVVVRFDALEEIPKLSVGQNIRIYTRQELIGNEIIPYKILIEED